MDNSDEGNVVLAISTSKSNPEWILDLWCLFHIFHVKSWFIKLKEEKCAHILLGDNSECEVKGVGKVTWRLSDGAKKVFIDVRFIPELKKNLNYVGVLDWLGYNIKIESGRLKSWRLPSHS